MILNDYKILNEKDIISAFSIKDNSLLSWRILRKAGQGVPVKFTDNAKSLLHQSHLTMFTGDIEYFPEDLEVDTLTLNARYNGADPIAVDCLPEKWRISKCVYTKGCLHTINRINCQAFYTGSFRPKASTSDSVIRIIDKYCEGFKQLCLHNPIYLKTIPSYFLDKDKSIFAPTSTKLEILIDSKVPADSFEDFCTLSQYSSISIKCVLEGNKKARYLNKRSKKRNASCMNFDYLYLCDMPITTLRDFKVPVLVVADCDSLTSITGTFDKLIISPELATKYMLGGLKIVNDSEKFYNGLQDRESVSKVLDVPMCEKRFLTNFAYHLQSSYKGTEGRKVV